MALLDEIGTRLSTQGIASSTGAAGWLLLLSWLPDSTAIQDKVVAVVQTPGAPANVGLDEYHFQVHVRGEPISVGSSAYTEAEAKAVEVMADLHNIAPGSLSGQHYCGIWAMQPPFLLEYDASERPHILNNYRALRSRTT